MQLPPQSALSPATSSPGSPASPAPTRRRWKPGVPVAPASPSGKTRSPTVSSARKAAAAAGWPTSRSSSRPAVARRSTAPEPKRSSRQAPSVVAWRLLGQQDYQHDNRDDHHHGRDHPDHPERVERSLPLHHPALAVH